MACRITIKNQTITVNASRRKMERLSDARFTEPQSALVDTDPFVRSAAISALSKPAFRDAVENELENKSPAVRLGALLALRRAGTEDGGVIFSKMLADPDEAIRRMALAWQCGTQVRLLSALMLSSWERRRSPLPNPRYILVVRVNYKLAFPFVDFRMTIHEGK